MTDDPRLEQAAADARLVVGATGLLADFNAGGVLGPLDVEAAAAIGRLCGESDEAVLLAAALAVRGTRFGHVCIRLDTVRESVVVDEQAQAGIDELPWPDPAEWEAAVASSRLAGGDDPPMVLDGGRLYLDRYHRYERQVAEMIRGRCAVPPRPLPKIADRVLQEVLGAAPADPEHRQLQAGRMAATGRLTVIAGGPGTGKTHTVCAVLAALVAAGHDPAEIGVCAPTGKAAARLGEALTAMARELSGGTASALVSIEPSTIHRMLGWSFRRAGFRHHAGNPLPHRTVVVDEMSMVSLPLAAKLLSAVGDDTAVVFVGDPFQLESIEAGTVLADIVAAAGPADPPGGALRDRVVVLDRGHRFEEHGVIAELADAVRRADADRAVELLAAGDEALRWVPARDTTEFEEVWERVIEHRTRMVLLAGEAGREEQALAALGELAVLCARRQGPDSVSRWRRDIEAELDLRFTGLRYGREWYPGRPVMVTSNDYTLDLFNGDIGVAAETVDGLRAVFERNGVRRLPPGQVGDHTTAHAMTIHKSQGSQFEEVAVVLPDDGSRLLTRELLYTAVTRASRRVWLLGSEDLVRRAIARSVERASGLSHLLR